jgi:hypothetical protein
VTECSPTKYDFQGSSESSKPARTFGVTNDDLILADDDEVSEDDVIFVEERTLSKGGETQKKQVPSLFRPKSPDDEMDLSSEGSRSNLLSPKWRSGDWLDSDPPKPRISLDGAEEDPVFSLSPIPPFRRSSWAGTQSPVSHSPPRGLPSCSSSPMSESPGYSPHGYYGSDVPSPSYQSPLFDSSVLPSARYTPEPEIRFLRPQPTPSQDSSPGDFSPLLDQQPESTRHSPGSSLVISEDEDDRVCKRDDGLRSPHYSPASPICSLIYSPASPVISLDEARENSPSHYTSPELEFSDEDDEEPRENSSSRHTSPESAFSDDDGASENSNSRHITPELELSDEDEDTDESEDEDAEEQPSTDALDQQAVTDGSDVPSLEVDDDNFSSPVEPALEANRSVLGTTEEKSPFVPFIVATPNLPTLGLDLDTADHWKNFEACFTAIVASSTAKDRETKVCSPEAVDGGQGLEDLSKEPDPPLSETLTEDPPKLKRTASEAELDVVDPSPSVHVAPAEEAPREIAASPAKRLRLAYRSSPVPQKRKRYPLTSSPPPPPPTLQTRRRRLSSRVVEWAAAFVLGSAATVFGLAAIGE